MGLEAKLHLRVCGLKPQPVSTSTALLSVQRADLRLGGGGRRLAKTHGSRRDETETAYGT